MYSKPVLVIWLIKQGSHMAYNPWTAKSAQLTAAFVWKNPFTKSPDIPNPSETGWEWNPRTKSCVHVPYCTDFAHVSKACSLLLHCGCLVSCRQL